MQYQTYQGYQFYQDKKTGYWISSKTFGDKKIHIRMHRFVWEKEKGAIPNNFHIHHIDFNKNNNTIDNLELVKRSLHLSEHSKKWHKENKEQVKNNLNKAREFANLWHRSEEGRKWHSTHAKSIKHKKDKPKTCLFCKKGFLAKTNSGKYCGNNCKANFNRKVRIKKFGMTDKQRYALNKSQVN